MSAGLQGLRLLALACLLLATVSSCAPVLKSPIGDEGEERASDRLDHGYSILLGLMAEEAKVDQILSIKSASRETETLLHDISITAKAAIEKINEEAKLPPMLLLENSGLPTIESDARARITNTQTVRLLLAMGSFELQILLTQEKAMGYAAALADSLAAADPNATRSDRMKKYAKTYGDLESRAIERIKALGSK